MTAEKRGREERDDGRKPASRVPKAERILNLIAVLLGRREPVPLSEILGRVTGYDDSASKSTLMRRYERDKQVLKKMGIPVKHCPPTASEVEGYTISRESYFLDELELPPNGALLVRALYAAALRGPSGELQDDLGRALLKLGFELPGGDPLDVVTGEDKLAREGRVVSLPFGAAGGAQKNLEVLSEAVLRRKRVRIKYHTLYRDELTTRDVDPYGLGLAGQAWNRASWYLVGHCHLRGGLRVFKVERLKGSVQLLRSSADEADFDPPPSFHVRDHLGRARWEMRELASAIGSGPGEGDEPPVVARVRFEKGVASVVQQLVPSARVEREAGDTVTLGFDVVGRRWFARFLLQYAGQFEILEPTAIKNEVAAVAAEVLARHKAAAPAGPAPGEATP